MRRRRILLLIGAVLFMGGGVFMFVSVLFAHQGLTVIEPVVCPPGSTITAEDVRIPSYGTNVNLYCVDAAGNRTDAFLPVMILMMGTFFVGVACLVLGVTVGRKRKRAGSGDDALGPKLRSLQSALDDGLITQAEFDRKRQALINDF